MYYAGRGKAPGLPMSKQTYQGRNEILRGMGYESYAIYLLSPLWVSIRKKAFQRSCGLCVLCREVANCVHHRGYGKRVLSGRDLSPLMPLCGSCHQKVEFKSSGKKRSLVQAQTRFNALYSGVKRGRGYVPVIQCKGVGCQNTPKRGRLYCTPCETGLTQVKDIVAWLRKSR